MMLLRMWIYLLVIFYWNLLILLFLFLYRLWFLIKFLWLRFLVWICFWYLLQMAVWSLLFGFSHLLSDLKLGSLYLVDHRNLLSNCTFFISKEEVVKNWHHQEQDHQKKHRVSLWDALNFKYNERDQESKEITTLRYRTPHGQCGCIGWVKILGSSLNISIIT